MACESPQIGTRPIGPKILHVKTRPHSRARNGGARRAIESVAPPLHQPDRGIVGADTDRTRADLVDVAGVCVRIALTANQLRPFTCKPGGLRRDELWLCESRCGAGHLPPQ